MNSPESNSRNAQVNARGVESFHDVWHAFTTSVNLYALEALPMCSVIVILSSFVYFGYRIRCLLTGQPSSAWLEVLVAWTFLGIELGMLSPSPQFEL